MRNQFDRSSNLFGGSDFFGFAPVFERFFEEGERTAHSAAVLTPACDLTETDHAFLVTLDMPGVAQEDIKIETVHNRLVVTAERRNAKTDKEGKWHMTERTFGKYQRAFALGNAIDLDKIQATYGDGVLHITLPKAELVKPRTIKIEPAKKEANAH